MAAISHITLPDGTDYNIQATGIFYGEVDSTSTSTVFTATIPGITEYYDGLTILLRNGVVTSASNFTININGLGAKGSYSNMSLGNPITPTNPTRDTTIFNINYAMLFVYNTTVVSGGCWICYRGYDANTNTIGYQIRTNSSSLPMTSVVYRYRLLFTSADNAHFVPANNSTSTNATSARTVCQDKINPFGRIVYYGTTASVAAGSRPSTSYLWDMYTLTLGYSFVVTLTAWKPVYLKCAPQSDGSAIIDSTTPFVQDLPTTEDGKIYIFLGVAYSTTAMELLLNHPVYYYSNGCIRQWTNSNKTEQTYNGNSSMSYTSYTNSIVNGSIAEISCESGSEKAFVQAYYDDSSDCPVIQIGATNSGTVGGTIVVDSTGTSIRNLVTPFYSTDAATKGYVDTAIGAISVPAAATANPLMDGTAAVGSSAKYAKEDHVHPSDTSKVNTTFSGESSMTYDSYTNTIVNSHIAEMKCESGTNGAYVQAYYDDSGACPTVYIGSKSGNTYPASIYVDPTGIQIYGLVAPTTNDSAATKAYVDSAVSGVSGLPTVTSSDNGKVLMVVNGAWAAANLPIYNGSVT